MTVIYHIIIAFLIFLSLNTQIPLSTVQDNKANLEYVAKDGNSSSVFLELSPLKIAMLILIVFVLMIALFGIRYFELKKMYGKQEDLSNELEKVSTELDNLSDLVKESEGKYNVIVNKCNDAVLIIKDFKIVYANLAYEDLVKQHYHDFINASVFDYISADEHTYFRKMIEQNIDIEDETTKFETILVDVSGKNIRVEINMTNIIYDKKISIMAILTRIEK